MLILPRLAIIHILLRFSVTLIPRGFNTRSFEYWSKIYSIKESTRKYEMWKLGISRKNHQFNWRVVRLQCRESCGLVEPEELRTAVYLKRKKKLTSNKSLKTDSNSINIITSDGILIRWKYDNKVTQSLELR